MVYKISKYDKLILLKGFTLIELVLIIAIMSVLLMISVPAYAGYRDKAIKRVCTTNCIQLERFYEMYLDLENLEHSDSLFIKFMEEYNQKICPSDIKTSYIGGKVKCEKHSTDDNSNNNEVEVPYL